jgi:hypothetical protein
VARVSDCPIVPLTLDRAARIVLCSSIKSFIEYLCVCYILLFIVLLENSAKWINYCFGMRSGFLQLWSWVIYHPYAVTRITGLSEAQLDGYASIH